MLKNRPPVDDALTELARNNRNNMTAQEKKIWYQFFSPSQFSVKRQYVIAPFIVDFYCPAAALVIEIDGVQHHSEEAKIYDKRRTEYLESKGLKVLRFTNRQIDDEFDAIKNYLAEIMQERIRKNNKKR